MCLVYQRPPTNGSTTTFSIGASPMWWLAGHHDVISSVKTSKQRFWSSPTETLTRTGLMVCWVIGLSPCVVCASAYWSSAYWANATMAFFQNRSR